jgi:hypothetical protein
VYQIPPSAAGATSWGCDLGGTSNSRTCSATAAGLAGLGDAPSEALGAAALADGAGRERATGGAGLGLLGAHAAMRAAATAIEASRRISGSLPVVD